MSEARYALYERLMGSRIIESNGIQWRQVRPYFYRPLLPYRSISKHMANLSRPHDSLGFQYAVSEGQRSNSWMDVIWFKDLQGYDLGTIGKGKRRQLKISKQHMELRQMKNLSEFQQHAYPVYLSFQGRTGYQFLSNRTQKHIFEAWAKHVFDFREIVVLGAFHDGKLSAICLSLLIHDVVIYTTFFSNNVALQFFVADLMLHTIRESARAHHQVTSIYVGMHKGKRGLDQFYLSRGAECASLPSMLSINPLVNTLLKYLRPKSYRQLQGGKGALPLPSCRPKRAVLTTH